LKFENKWFGKVIVRLYSDSMLNVKNYLTIFSLFFIIEIFRIVNEM